MSEIVHQNLPTLHFWDLLSSQKQSGTSSLSQILISTYCREKGLAISDFILLEKKIYIILIREFFCAKRKSFKWSHIKLPSQNYKTWNNIFRQTKIDLIKENLLQINGDAERGVAGGRLRPPHYYFPPRFLDGTPPLN